MVAEVLHHSRPRPGDVVVDCTVGDGGHARALREALGGDGLLIGLDVDAEQISRARDRLGVSASVATLDDRTPRRASVSLRQASFASLRDVLDDESVTGADVVVADLGVASAQFDDPERGLNYKAVGPLDMRLDRSRGTTAHELIAASQESQLEEILRNNADEPQAALIARLLKSPRPVTTSHDLARRVRSGLLAANPTLTGLEAKDSVRRTFQALRIAVNHELGALDSLLAALPACLARGSRVVIITFHVGEERRVKGAFAQAHRSGVYAEVSDGIIRPSRSEILANRRSSSARLHWAIRA